MKISVVMSTYNGEKYLLEQLDSIRLQTKTPDEVLIFDDCSTDETFEMLIEYIQKHNLTAWKAEKNPTNYGWRKSFAQGIAKATGDIIFTADQDDIWISNKVQIMSEVLLEKDKINLLVSNYLEMQFDDKPNCIGQKDTYSVKQILFKAKWFHIQRPGCVFAFRKSLVQPFADIWFNNYAHDELLWHLGALTDGLYIIDYTSILFRRHSNNATPSNAHNKNTRALNCEIAIEEIERLIEYTNKHNGWIDHNKYREMNRYFAFEKNRKALLRRFDLLSMLKLASDIACYIKPQSYLVDIYCALQR